MSATKSCGVCLDAPHKYKCPKCYVKYCSVPCYKKHTESSCQPLPKLDEVNRDRGQPTNERLPFVIDAKKSVLFPSEEGFTENTVLPEKLQLLRSDEGVSSCLQNPHLRDLLRHLNGAAEPEKALHDAMMEPLFVELADHCLRVVDEKEQK